MNLYKIDGGIGKNIFFTGLIKELFEREGQICIETSYPEVFIGFEKEVAKVYFSNEPKDFKKFYAHFDKIYAHDPYIGNMWKGGIHVVQAWADLINLPTNKLENRFPVIKAETNKNDLEQIQSKLKDKKYIVIQIAGGQSPYEIQDLNNLPPYERNHMRAGRNFTSMDALFEELEKQFPDHEIVQFGLPNEPKMNGAIQFNMHYVSWFEVFKNCDFYIGIDSMMQHYMAGIKKPGIVYWDLNDSNEFGWRYKGRFNYDSALPGGITVNQKLAQKSIGELKSFLNKK